MIKQLNDRKGEGGQRGALTFWIWVLYGCKRLRECIYHIQRCALLPSYLQVLVNLVAGNVLPEFC